MAVVMVAFLLATALGWHAPFIAIAVVSLAIGAVAPWTLPRLGGPPCPPPGQ
jgi:predicted MFS family arabinose efflux permease